VNIKKFLLPSPLYCYFIVITSAFPHLLFFDGILVVGKQPVVQLRLTPPLTMKCPCTSPSFCQFTLFLLQTACSNRLVTADSLSASFFVFLLSPPLFLSSFPFFFYFFQPTFVFFLSDIVCPSFLSNAFFQFVLGTIENAWVPPPRVLVL